ncbi:MAG: hypothetical protein EXR71_18340 [Myxococcales bacterium]|nr:hypothetical protein [Myxococcales bacterium]
MIRSTIKRILGLGEKKVAPPPPPPARKPPPPRPAPTQEEDRGHDHGHSHGGGHDHGHAHGGAQEAAPADPAAEVGAHIKIEESETPNPNAHKFTCSVSVIEKGSASFNTAEEADSHPLSRQIWAVGGIKGVFAVKDFVTITKNADAEWANISPKIPAAIRRGLIERG